MYATRARQSRPELFDDRPTIGERLGLAQMDWVLTFSAIGLIAFSVLTLGQATTHDIPGSPNYYVERQAIYGFAGIVGMLVLSRIDYSRFRELRVGIYTFVCISIALVFVVGAAALGSRRSFELPFFSFQPSELGKLLLVLALAGFVIEGTTPYGKMTSSVRQAVLRKAIHSGLPVVRVGRGNPEGFADPDDYFIAGSNLTSTKARLLLMACLLKFGSLPPARNPDEPTSAELAAIRTAVAAYQKIFDTH